MVGEGRAARARSALALSEKTPPPWRTAPSGGRGLADGGLPVNLKETLVLWQSRPSCALRLQYLYRRTDAIYHHIILAWR